MPFFPRTGLKTTTMQLLATILLLVQVALGQPGCQTQTESNPIAERFPESITGVANGTFSIAFIDRQVADSILPRGFSFLDDEYQREVAAWQEDKFPVLIRAVYVHDIRSRDRMVRDHRGVRQNQSKQSRSACIAFSP